MVSSASNLQDDNPDVIDASAITNVAVDIDESKHELRTKDEEGRSVSYNPPRYDFSYDFYVNIDVSHPYCSHRRIKVNSSSVWQRLGKVRLSAVQRHHRFRQSQHGHFL